MYKEWINRALALLINSLQTIPQELNELDWKEHLSPNKDRLCQHLSAFANQPGGGFLAFGIRDTDAAVVGLSREVAANIIERLADIGRNTLEPPVSIDHTIETYEGKYVLLIYIKESSVKPVIRRGGRLEDTWIRSGGTTRQASRHDVGGLLLNSKTPHFEELHATKAKTLDEVLTLLDYRSIFGLLRKPIPSSKEEIISWMVDEKMVEAVDGAGYYITNIGALSAAYDLNSFDGLARKTIRLIRYNGVNKINTIREYPGKMGYAIGFEGLITFLKDMLPGSEIIKNAFRHETSIYPLIALRELIANALIHQDLTVKGAGPMIEVFDDRIEISNPGKLLPSKKIDRLIRTTPESRNEVLASAFRRYYICEERGSGMEKAVTAIELYGLPPLKFEENANSFRVTMYSPRSFANMTQTERIEACYQHSIIRYFSSDGMTNTSLRERFKMNEKQRSQISRIIRDAIEAGRIKLKDPNSSAVKFAVYIPYWG
ncbi:helix-turn-helix domain-containing protein [Spirosoma daeguense]